MKSGARLLGWVFAGLLLSILVSYPTTAQTKWIPSGGGTNQFQTFALHQNGRGEVTCREATAAERQGIADRSRGGPTGVIYSGAPRQKDLPYGTQAWTSDETAGLALQVSAGLRIVLHGTAQLEQNQTAKNAFIVAANRWEAIISTPITVVIDVDFGTTYFGQAWPDPSIIGATGVSSLTGPYTDLRQRLIDGASTNAEQQLYNALPASAVPVEFNGAFTSVTDAELSTPNARALGIAPDISDPNSVPLGQGDAGIGFNSAFQFDFNPDDGISSGQLDFDSVASHEMGHALGFVSDSGGSSASPISVWDLFRFVTSTLTLSEFTNSPRVMSKGGTQVFVNNQPSTFGTVGLLLSTGGPDPGPNDGDGRQSSHWKDDALSSTRPYIGVMDPTLAPGLRRTISENDIAAIDVFGYSIGLPAPVRPPNDNFANAIALQANSGTLSTTNVSATREANEPNHAGFMGDKSIWYSWVSPLNGQMTIDTIGSDFDTTLAVYTGTALIQLQTIAQNDDIAPGTNRASRVQFNIAAGTTYRIAVDGWNGEYGNVTVNWNATGVVPTPTPTPTPSPTPTPTPTPAADLAIESFSAAPDPVAATQYVNFAVAGHNLGPGAAPNTTVTITLPSGTSFANCTPACTGPGVSDGGTVTALLGTIASGGSIDFVVNAQVTAPSGAILTATSSVTSSIQDSNNSNNSANATAHVVDAIPFTGAQAIALNTEGGHVLVLRGGTVWSWGANGSGQLGDGTTTLRTLPAQVDDLMSVLAIGASNAFSVALKSDGTVWTWGSNEWGYLATGSTTPSNSTRPVQSMLTSVVAIAVGDNHALALKSDGTVWGWGSNAFGELGIGSQDGGAHPTPNQVPGLSNVVRIFAGDGLSYAVKSDGTVFGWGFAYGGNLGDGTTGQDIISPVELPSLKGMIGLGSAAGATLAIKPDNSVLSFGGNYRGKLGRGITDNSTYPIPTQIPGLFAKGAAGGYQHMIVIEPGGTLKAFGANDTGELGLGSYDVLSHASPAAVPGISNVFATAAGGSEGGGDTLALIGDSQSGGTIKAWGRNRFGVLGIGSVYPAYIPTTVMENPIVAKPIFSLPEGPLVTGSAVTIVCGTPSSVIHYTTNGQDPTEADAVVTSGASINVDHNLTLKAKAFRNGFASSLVKSATYTVGAPTPTPTPTPTATYTISGHVTDGFGNMISGATVTLSNGDSGATIGTTSTDGNAAYSFSNLQAGNYSVGASLPGRHDTLTFSTDVKNLNSNVTKDLQVLFFVTFHVLVRDAAGVGVGGVCIMINSDPLSCALAQTNTFGVLNVGVNVPFTGNGPPKTLTPQKTGNLFNPPSVTLSTQNGDQNVSFTASIAPVISFSSSSYSVGEGDGRVNITLIRSGDTTSSASVNYATNDSAGLTNCNVFNGVASPRCDYINTQGTMTFGPGETSKTFSVAIVDDAYAEGNETFTIGLNTPSGATLGAQSTATVTITDNETVNGTNPIDNTNFFVRQQYIDFLGREPDPPGLAGWTSTINNCSGDTTQCDRIHVSQLFFQSEEFQSRGYFAYRFYPVAFGRKPDYSEFVPDLARVSGFLDANQLEAAKIAFIADFMARAAFVSTYNSLTNQQYVDALLNTANAGIGASTRQSMIDGLNNATMTRAQVLRQIVESPEVSTKYNHQAYAVMEYFGYLRRQPDSFYLTWIQVLDQSNDPRGMVTGFVTSQEYRNRFGP